MVPYRRHLAESARRGGGGWGDMPKKSTQNTLKIPKIKRGVVYFTSKIGCKENKRCTDYPNFNRKMPYTNTVTARPILGGKVSFARHQHDKNR